MRNSTSFNEGKSAQELPHSPDFWWGNDKKSEELRQKLPIRPLLSVVTSVVLSSKLCGLFQSAEVVAYRHAYDSSGSLIFVKNSGHIRFLGLKNIISAKINLLKWLSVTPKD